MRLHLRLPVVLQALAVIPLYSAFVQERMTFIRTNHPYSAVESLAFEQPKKSKSALSMGAMEDFFEGADSSKRESENKAYIATLEERVKRVNDLEPTIEELGDDELEAKTAEFKERLKNGEDLNGPLLEEAFAVVREAAWYVNRVLYKK